MDNEDLQFDMNTVGGKERKRFFFLTCASPPPRHKEKKFFPVLSRVFPLSKAAHQPQCQCLNKNKCLLGTGESCRKRKERLN